ncbi:MAG: PEP-CTERM sorting domain-containing protein, partial [Anaerolineae bacterium]
GVAQPPQVWGPDFANHEWYAANLVNPWTPAGAQFTMGTGTAANPWWVGTYVTGPFPYSVDQWVRYIDGDDCFTVSYIINDGELGTPEDITFFHAADLYVDGDDGGFGYYDAATGAVGAWNQPRDFLEYLVPLTVANGLPLPAASHYQEASSQSIWDNIGDLSGPGPGFNNTILATPYHDSGCGLQWDLQLPGVPPDGNFVELALDWCFLQEEEPEFVPEPGSVMLLASGLMGLAGYAGLRKWRG